MRGFGEQNSESLQILFDRLISMGKKLEGIYSTPIVELFSLNLLQNFSITSKPTQGLIASQPLDLACAAQMSRAALARSRPGSSHATRLRP